MNKAIEIPETTRRILLKKSIQVLGVITATPVLSSNVFAKALLNPAA